ncbi:MULTISPECIES: DNA primase [unclassified Campylobacter]|uniref:DNA primase n=1 Tax=unclassified Campylobacter TaxID=2593542 RepID=UPI003D328DE8
MIQNLDDFKASIDICDVISSYLPLKKNGANFSAVCPFHADTKPSLIISPSKQIYHCFACGAGGDAIRFVSEYKKLSFEEACEEIADKINFTLIKSSSVNSSIKAKADNELLEYAKDSYKNELFKVMGYIKERGISDEMVQKFELGFGIELANIKQEDKKRFGFWLFNNRLIFPIKLHTGRVVGFGGRSLDKNVNPKYTNSPQSNVFNKSTLLYGLDVAKPEIIRTKEVVICEGYIDVIMAHQAGVNNAIATLGTALTKEHLSQIVKFGVKITLFFDNDNAGRAACLKGIELLCLNRLYDSYVMVVNTKYKDIADMVKNGESDKLLNAKKEPIIKYYIDYIMQGFFDLAIESRMQKVANLKRFINSIDDSFLKREYKAYATHTYELNENSLDMPARVKQAILNRYDPIEAALIKFMALNPENKSYVTEFLTVDEFETTKEAFRAVISDTTSVALREVLLYQTPETNMQVAVRTLYAKKLKRLLSEAIKRRNFKEISQVRAMIRRFNE